MTDRDTWAADMEALVARLERDARALVAERDLFRSTVEKALGVLVRHAQGDLTDKETLDRLYGVLDKPELAEALGYRESPFQKRPHLTVVQYDDS